jgi:hypothetical protein
VGYKGSIVSCGVAHKCVKKAVEIPLEKKESRVGLCRSQMNLKKMLDPPTSVRNQDAGLCRSQMHKNSVEIPIEQLGIYCSINICTKQKVLRKNHDPYLQH